MTMCYVIVTFTYVSLQESGSEACLKDLLAADAFTDDKVVNHWKSVLTAASGIACTMRAMHATQACQGHLNPAAVVIQVRPTPILPY